MQWFFNVDGDGDDAAFGRFGRFGKMDRMRCRAMRRSIGWLA